MSLVPVRSEGYDDVIIDGLDHQFTRNALTIFGAEWYVKEAIDKLLEYVFGIFR